MGPTRRKHMGHAADNSFKGLDQHKEGTTVTVDDLRAAWLKKAGFEAKKGKKSK